VNVGDLQGFLRTLGALLAANQGGKPAAEFEAFCAGLEPFREQSVGVFAQFLQDAAEYKRTGKVPEPVGKRGAGRRQAGPKAGAPKPALKKKDDLEAVEAAAACLQALYDRATDPTLSHTAIETEVNRIDREFDAEGLKAVARRFGITSGLSGKAAARTKILNRIAERKGQHERGAVIAGIAQASAPPPVTAARPQEPDVVVEAGPPTAGAATGGASLRPSTP
jgi:hypothetical protein